MQADALKAKRVLHKCAGCGERYAHSFVPFCPSCGHLIDVEYDLSSVSLRASENSLIRFFDLLPIENPANLLPVRITPTPCIHAERLGESLEMPALYLKNETVLPTGTTKARMAAVALSFLKDCGVREFCASSTGNSSSAFAHAVKDDPGCRIHLFTAERFVNRVQCDSSQVTHYALRGASFVEAARFAIAFANRHGLVAERGFFNPGRREGLKLAFMEATEQIAEPIDWYVQAVSSGMGVYGTYKAARELSALGRLERLPRLLCVQQSSCAPMVKAFEQGSDRIAPQHVVSDPVGIAASILRGDPTRAYPYMHRIVTESNGLFLSVEEAEIREARRLTVELQGIDCCFSAATAVAGAIKLFRSGGIRKDECVLVNLTGRDRPPQPVGSGVRWLSRSDDVDWIPVETCSEKNITGGTRES